MTALLLTALFAFSAAFAVAAMLATWRSNAKAIFALRRQLRDCPDMRDVRYSLRTLEVRSFGAKVYRPDFKSPDFKSARRQSCEETILAAA